MKIAPLEDHKLVQNFLATAAGKSGAEFLASPDWAQLIEQEGIKVETCGVYDEAEELIAIFNLIKVRSFYYYSPRGPVFKSELPLDEKKIVWQFLYDYFKKQGVIFWRVEPQEDPLISCQKTNNLQPAETLMLDLRVSEVELLNNFHPKTRYNIKLAEKKGVSIREGNSLADFEKFWQLMTETGRRDAFKIHNKKHYQMLATANSDFIKLFLAEADGKTVAAGLFSFYGNKVTYLHGASDHSSRQLMAPYLLQWALIKLAKNKNYKYYDFYGVDAKKWPGVTRFKLGFSGYRITYAGTFDVVLNRPKYYLYNLLRQVKRFL